MKKIVVTGATSMLGVATIEECLKNDIEVLAIAHRNSKNFHRLPNSPKLKIIEKDLDEFADYEPNFIDADVFYHFAWSATTHQGRMNIDIQNANIGYTVNAVRLAKKFGCKKFIFAGSQAENGLSDQPLNRITPIRPFIPYGVAKYAASKFAEMLCQELDITFVEGRIVSVFGLNDGSNTLISYLIDCYLQNIQPVLTPCDQIWDYLYSDDAACAFRLLGEKPVEGIYFVGSGQGKPIKDYVKIIYDLMTPDVSLTFGGKPYGENQVMHLIADISDLKHDTGFEPKTPFKDAIKMVISGRTELNKRRGGGTKKLLLLIVIWIVVTCRRGYN